MERRQPRRAFLVRCNSRGLNHDAGLLAPLLRAAGYETVDVLHPHSWPQASVTWRCPVDPAPVAGDMVVFFENVAPLRELFQEKGVFRVLIPNSELLSDAHCQWANVLLDEVWHKTQLSWKVYQMVAPAGPLAPLPRHRMTAFKSRDLYLPEVPKAWKTDVLHVFGTSPTKGSRMLLELWGRHPEWPTLHMVGTSLGQLPDAPAPNVRFRAYVPDDELRLLMNRVGIHACTSVAEGWGHYLLEAMSCKAVVITTNAPPMSDHIQDGIHGVLLDVMAAFPYRDKARQESNDDRGNNVATWSVFRPAAFEATLGRLLQLSEEALAKMGERARAKFEATCARFDAQMSEILAAPQVAGAAAE